MAPNTKDGMNEFFKWLANGALYVAIAVLSWNFIRECDRNETQEQRLYTLERTIVRIDYMAADLTELKSDMKKLLRGNTQ